MAGRFLDGFDYYSTSDLTRKWTSIVSTPTVQSGTVRTGSNALQANSTRAVKLTLDSQATWIIGFGFRVTSFANAQRLLEFIDSTTTQCSLLLATDGTLDVVRGISTVVTDGAGTFVLNINTWYYIEMKVTIANSIGANTCQVQVNGANDITVATGQDLQVSGNATADNFELGMLNAGGATGFFDDVYIFDGTGSESNDFAGDSKIVTQYPDGEGNVNSFTGSDADSTDNHLHVDETDTDDDTSFNESSTVDHIDLYTFDDLAVTPATIHTIQINMVVKKDDAGGRTIRSMTRPVSTNIESTEIYSPSNGSYLNFMKIYDLNPEVSSAWTESTFNATEFGITIEA